MHLSYTTILQLELLFNIKTQSVKQSVFDTLNRTHVRAVRASDAVDGRGEAHAPLVSSRAVVGPGLPPLLDSRVADTGGAV